MVEEFSFLIKDFKIEHQGETNNLNITIQYRYRVDISDSEYPDFRLVAKDIEMFLTNYPNEKDYWEILNRKSPYWYSTNIHQLQRSPARCRYLRRLLILICVQVL
jgi:hypothetical protein